MKNISYVIFAVCVLTAVSGCRTTQPVNAAGENIQDIQKSVGTVAEGMTGRKMSPEDMKRLEHQMQTDPEAKRAIETITGGGQAVIKYCPIDGERYAASMDICPIHHVKLEVVEP